MHERQAIREAAIAMLVGKTAAGLNVKKRRLAPLPEQTLPAIHVFIDDEPVDADSVSKSPRELQRRCNLQIGGFVTADIDVIDDVIDNLALQIESAMDADPWLDENAFTCILTNTVMDLSTAGSRPQGGVLLTYAVVYHTQPRPAAASYAALPDLDQTDIKITPPGATSLTVPPVVEGLKTEIHEESTEQVP